MFEVFKGLNFEEANSVAYYTVKALNNIDVDELMKINNDGDIKVSNISKELTKNILNKSRNSTTGVNHYIEEMNSILECKPIYTGDVSVCMAPSKPRKYGKVCNNHGRKTNLFHRSSLHTYK